MYIASQSRCDIISFRSLMSQNSNFQYTSAMAGVVGQVGCLVILMIGVALAAGMFLDRYLETDGIFTVIFLVGSVPVALYLTMRVAMNAANRVQYIINEQKAEDEKEDQDKDGSGSD